MIVSTYNPKDAKATCPQCGFVDCELLEAFLIGSPKRLKFYHEYCQTTWEVYV
jgi:hypothetical protein